ncbi:MAG: hypothetical protein EOP07_07905 [Proteobacteria bacterium]|nr:MAG: hypothetical protein EOP07_07905 [Pseudomonadota bacterium]
MPVKKPSKKKVAKKKTSKSLSAKGVKDPEGGLTAKGRAYFKKKEGAHLKPGVKGKADTPEKMKRKGSFLRRHYANLAGPLKKENGEPTRLALAAHAWGEKVPKTLAEAKKLADKGSKLLERYERSKAKKKAPVKKITTTKKKSKSTVKKVTKKKKKKKTKATR